MSDSTPLDTSPREATADAGGEGGGEAPAASAERLPRPRIRIGAVLWGLVLLAAGIAALWIATSPARRAAALDAVLGLDGLGWTVVVVVGLGATITLLALAAVIRRLQRRP